MYQIKCDAHGNILFRSLNQYFCNVDVLVSDTITMVYSSVKSYSWLLPASCHKYQREFFKYLKTENLLLPL